MTRVSLFRDPQGRLCGFQCRGHAGYAEEGSDIVCAAVSALSITCCNALESVAKVSPEVTERDGLLTVRVGPERLNHDGEIVLRVFEQGIGDIAASYPKHIAFTAR